MMRRLLMLMAAVAMVSCGGGSSTPTTPTPPNPTPPGPGGNPQTATMTIGADGRLTPASVTIAPGGRVTVVNNHNRPYDLQSDPHPEHTQCPELSQIGFLQPGQQRASGNLNTARTCGFHDHNVPENTNVHGRVVIQ